MSALSRSDNEPDEQIEQIRKWSNRQEGARLLSFAPLTFHTYSAGSFLPTEEGHQMRSICTASLRVSAHRSSVLGTRSQSEHSNADQPAALRFEWFLGGRFYLLESAILFLLPSSICLSYRKLFTLTRKCVMRISLVRSSSLIGRRYRWVVNDSKEVEHLSCKHGQERFYVV